MSPRKFVEIAKEYLSNLKDWKFKEDVCPDQYVGIIEKINRDKSHPDVFAIRKEVPECPQGIAGCLILVLESPHVNEFIGEIGPAKGHTGRMIQSYIKVAAQDIKNIENHALIVMNAIRYQCSLGQPTHKFRDDVFRLTWGNQGRKDFKERLARAINIINKNNPLYIFNCCTKGNFKDKNDEDLRLLVHAAIKEVIRDSKKNIYLEGRNHPSSWFNKKNRDSVWDKNMSCEKTVE
ncbi:MAG TPA: hypothetical protein PLV42_02440 [bacterium]|nr:hypothetical protein [bacterium]